MEFKKRRMERVRPPDLTVWVASLTAEGMEAMVLTGSRYMLMMGSAMKPSTNIAVTKINNVNPSWAAVEEIHLPYDSR